MTLDITLQQHNIATNVIINIIENFRQSVKQVQMNVGLTCKTFFDNTSMERLFSSESQSEVTSFARHKIILDN